MKHYPGRLSFLAFVSLVALLGSGCRGMQINKLEDRIAQLETRVAVLESKATSHSHP